METGGSQPRSACSKGTSHVFPVSGALLCASCYGEGTEEISSPAKWAGGCFKLKTPEQTTAAKETLSKQAELEIQLPLTLPLKELPV